MHFAEFVESIVDMLGSFTSSRKQRYERNDDRPAKRHKISVATADVTVDRPKTKLWGKGRRSMDRIAPTEIDGQEAK